MATSSPAVFILKASRPGLWFVTLWLYLMPLAGSIDLHSPRFWAGLLAVTFPLNLVVYGWNDLVDRETDRANARKDSWLFGARGTDAQLDALLENINGNVVLARNGLVGMKDGIDGNKKAKSAEKEIQTNLHALLTKKFQELLDKYNEIQMAYKVRGGGGGGGGEGC